MAKASATSQWYKESHWFIDDNHWTTTSIGKLEYIHDSSGKHWFYHAGLPASQDQWPVLRITESKYHEVLAAWQGISCREGERYKVRSDRLGEEW